jgi:DNA (cytosine-5)-methyltransferase 1
MTRPIGIDLFAGAGGLSLGFEQAGFDIVAAVEIDPIHCATHQFNFPHCTTICKSATDLTGDELRRLANIGCRDLDILIGGPPCQGFSLMGKRALDDARNQLVFHYVRLVMELKPKYFVFENVKGLTIGKHRRFLQEIIEAFGEGGYDVVADYKVLNAKDYGVPQDRRRLFLIGARAGLRLPTYPQPSGQTTVGEAIGDIPDAETFPELWERDWIETPLGQQSTYAAMLSGNQDDPQNFGYPRQYNAKLLTCSLLTNHTPRSRQRFARTAPNDVEPISHFKKLALDGISNTLRAGTASDRGAFTSPRPIHPTSPRVITVREAARIHSYPDWFRFHATKWHGFRQIGNSVPPLLARAVGAEIMKALGKKPQQPDEILTLRDEHLIGISMSDAAALFGVSSTVIAPRTRRKGETRSRISLDPVGYK